MWNWINSELRVFWKRVSVCIYIINKLVSSFTYSQTCHISLDLTQENTEKTHVPAESLAALSVSSENTNSCYADKPSENKLPKSASLNTDEELWRLTYRNSFSLKFKSECSAEMQAEIFSCSKVYLTLVFSYMLNRYPIYSKWR